MSIEARLAELGIVLPHPAAPVASYVPVVIAGGLAHVSGQLPFIDGRLVTGRLGEEVDLELGAKAVGAISNDTIGIANRLASGPIHEADAKNAAPKGSNIKVTAHWARKASRHQRRRAGSASRRCPYQVIAQTAPKDSQKPADSGAQGSTRTMISIASDKTGPRPRRRAEPLARPAPNSIQQVRCAGIAQPESAA